MVVFFMDEVKCKQYLKPGQQPAEDWREAEVSGCRVTFTKEYVQAQKQAATSVLTGLLANIES